MTSKFDSFYKLCKEHYDRSNLSNMFLQELQKYPRSEIKAVNEWIEKELKYLANQAETGHIDVSMWKVPHPPIYRRDYKKHREIYDNAAHYIQSTVLDFLARSPRKRY